MGTALHEVDPSPRASEPAARTRALVHGTLTWAPALTVAVFVVPIGAGLLGTLAPAAMAQDAAELRIAENQFPTSLDSDVGFAGYSLMSYGVAEALMRVTPDSVAEVRTG